MDDCYCLIKVTYVSYLVLCLFRNKYVHKYPICLVSHSSSSIYELINSHDGFYRLSISHAIYLGKEIYKAELSLITGQTYIQS